MKKKACVIQFLGSNCDDEAVRAIQSGGFSVEKVFYSNGLNLNEKYDLIFIPGGFSYGDYLRTGAMASKSKIMQDISHFANKGVMVIGVCNGFQILTESGLLDGALTKNINDSFVCKNIYVKNTKTQLFNNLDDVLQIQIAHGEGNYYNTQDGIKKLQDNNMIAFYYCSQDGIIDEYNKETNPNGSIKSIAGIFGGKNKNILGLMPHPERMFASGLSKSFFECLI